MNKMLNSIHFIPHPSALIPKKIRPKLARRNSTRQAFVGSWSRRSDARQPAHFFASDEET